MNGRSRIHAPAILAFLTMVSLIIGTVVAALWIGLHA